MSKAGCPEPREGKRRVQTRGSMRGTQESFSVREEGSFEAVADEMPPALQLRLRRGEGRRRWSFPFFLFHTAL